MTASSAAANVRPRRAGLARARYVGVDLARFVAIAGMMAAHLIGPNTVLPNVSDSQRDFAQSVDAITNGTSAALFAVLGGVSLVFASRRFISSGRIGAAITSVALRGTFLVLLGLLLGLFEGRVIVILAYYGVAMLLVAPLVAAPKRVLWGLVLLLSAVSGLCNAWVRSSLEVEREGPHITFEMIGDEPDAVLRAVLLTGTYPAATWCIYMLVGILIGRALEAAAARGALTRVATMLAGLGIALFALAQTVSNLILGRLEELEVDLGLEGRGNVDYTLVPEWLLSQNHGAPPSTDLWMQLVAVPHSGSIGDLVRTIGIALAATGVLVMMFDRAGAAGRQPGPVLDTVRATGAAPLTVYSLHIIITAYVAAPFFEAHTFDAPAPWWALGPWAFVLQIGGALALGTVLSATKRRGPLEAAMSRLVGLVVR